MPVWCTNRSLPGSSGVMKPNPLSSLNHFTVPVAICVPPGMCTAERGGCYEATTAVTRGTASPSSSSAFSSVYRPVRLRRGRRVDCRLLHIRPPFLCVLLGLLLGAPLQQPQLAVPLRHRRPPLTA